MKKSNWIWWTIGGIATIGLGIGVYAFVKEKKRLKALSQSSGQGQSTSTSSPTTSTNTGSSTSSPFANRAEGDAFRAWINDNYPDYARSIDLDRSGSHTNSYILRAWSDYGQIYQNRVQTPPTSTTPTPSQGDGSAWGIIKNQMLNQNIWGNTIRITEDTMEKMRFGVNVDGFYDIYVNFTPSGGFWIEKTLGAKFTGSWSFSNGIFTLKLTDNSFNAQDNEISEMVKQTMKLKFPNEMKYFSFQDENTLSDMEKVLKESKAPYVDPQDAIR
jgi:hypothetical protein